MHHSPPFVSNWIFEYFDNLALSGHQWSFYPEGFQHVELPWPLWESLLQDTVVTTVTCHGSDWFWTFRETSEIAQLSQQRVNCELRWCLGLRCLPPSRIGRKGSAVFGGCQACRCRQWFSSPRLEQRDFANVQKMATIMAIGVIEDNNFQFRFSLRFPIASKGSHFHCLRVALALEDWIHRWRDKHIIYSYTHILYHMHILYIYALNITLIVIILQASVCYNMNILYWPGCPEKGCGMKERWRLVRMFNEVDLYGPRQYNFRGVCHRWWLPIHIYFFIVCSPIYF